MAERSKPIEVRFLPQAKKYFLEQNGKVQDKFLKAFDKTQIGLIGDWFKPLKNTNGIWEFRVRDHQKFYRIFAFWDTTHDSKTLILASHGFDKKTNKTPRKEIEKAESIKQKYFEDLK